MELLFFLFVIAAVFFLFPLIGVFVGAFAGWIVSSFDLTSGWVISGFAVFGIQIVRDNLIAIGATLGFMSGFFKSSCSSKNTGD